MGIGARNLHECLLIQLDYLERARVEQPYAREIIETYLVELGEHKFGKIAHELKISPETVSDVWEFVKSKLNPHPAHGFSATNTARPRHPRHVHPAGRHHLAKAENADFEVEVVESRRFMLRVNPMYTRISRASYRRTAPSPPRRSVTSSSTSGGPSCSSPTSISAARRSSTSPTCLVGKQRDFLEKGVRHLKPLSRAAVAAELGIHESTVSRATAAKYVMLPDGEVIPFSHFFTPSLSVKDIIKEMIEKEGGRSPTRRSPSGCASAASRSRGGRSPKYRMQLDMLHRRRASEIETTAGGWCVGVFVAAVAAVAVAVAVVVTVSVEVGVRVLVVVGDAVVVGVTGWSAVEPVRGRQDPALFVELLGFRRGGGAGR